MFSLFSHFLKLDCSFFVFVSVPFSFLAKWSDLSANCPDACNISNICYGLRKCHSEFIVSLDVLVTSQSWSLENKKSLLASEPAANFPLSIVSDIFWWLLFVFVTIIKNDQEFSWSSFQWKYSHSLVTSEPRWTFI